MKAAFYKFHGNGNDFVVVDGRNKQLDFTQDRVKKICDRHFGIGADGMIIVRDDVELDFEMQYFNADGKLASMCGNGGRCAVAFAFMINIAGNQMRFRAYDGFHEALINAETKSESQWDVSLSLNPVKGAEKENGFYVLDTGSPHYVEFVEKVAELDVVGDGRKTRYSERFSPEGINVNFVEINEKRLFVRTYERGVENETLSCGTGVTASAIAAFIETGQKGFSIHTTGGDFRVDFEEKDGKFEDIWLSGPAELVFKGTIEV